MMPDCKDMFALLSEYLDQELEPQSCEEIERHLEHCPPCIEFVESLKRSVKVCRDCGGQEKPAALSEEDKEKLRAAYKDAMARKGGGL
jgi:anti-sigma factor (TIGR02949 family)